MLEYTGKKSVTASATDGMAPVDAAASKLTYGRSLPSRHGTASPSPISDIPSVIYVLSSSDPALVPESCQLAYVSTRQRIGDLRVLPIGAHEFGRQR